MTPANIITLITALLPIVLQYEPKLVQAVSDLIHKHPPVNGETDEQYVARLSAMLDASLADAKANDAAVEAAPDGVTDNLPPAQGAAPALAQADGHPGSPARP